MKTNEVLHLSSSVLIAIMLATLNAPAADTWVGNTSPNWNTSANWSPTSVPVANDQLSFISAGTAGATLTNDIAAGTVFNGITFQSGGSAFTFVGNAIGLNGGITNSGTSTQVISNNLTLKGNETINVGTGNITLAGAIDDGGNGYSLTKLGTGINILSGVNTFTGGLAINSGTVRLATAGSLPSTATVNFHNATNGTTATLDIQGLSQTLANLNFTNFGTSTITLTGTSGSALTVSPSTLLLTGNGVTNTLNLNMAGLSSFTYNNSSGTITEEIGLNAPSGIAASGLTTVTLAGGSNFVTAATLAVGGNSPASTTPVTTLNLGTNNTFNVNTITLGSGRGGDTVQFASGIANGTLTIAGAAGGGSLTTFTTAGHESFQLTDKPVDLFDVSAGTLTAQFGNMTIGQVSPASGSGRGVTATSSFKMGAGTLTASSLTLGKINSQATSTNGLYTITALFSITNGGTANITNLTLAVNNLVPVNTAHLTNTATVSLTNGATLNAGTVALGANASTSITTAQVLWGDGTIGNISGGGLTISGINIVQAGAATSHKFNISSGQSGVINSAISGTGTLTDVGAGALTLAGNNTFTGSLVMAGTNTLTLSGANTYTGSTVVSNGTLIVGGSGSLTSPTINVASNAVFDVSAFSPFTLGASGSQSLTGNGSINGSVNANTGSQIIPGGTGAAGTLTFSNNLTLNGQTLVFDLSSSPAGGNDQINLGGALTLNANSTIWINLLNGSLSAGTYTLMTYSSVNTNSFNLVLVAPRGTTLNVGPTALTLNVTGSGSANLTWVGDGTANNWDLQTTTNWVNAGNLDVFYQLDNVIFDNTGSATPAVNLTTTLAPASMTVNGSQNYTFSGAGQLVGVMALTNNDAGTLTLTTSNLYSGGTVINNGTLELAFTNATAGLPDLAAGIGPIIDNSILNITNGGGAPVYVLVTNIIAGSGSINLPQNQEVKFNGPGSMSGFSGSINIPPSATTAAKGDITGSNINLNASAIINIASGGTIWVGGAGVVVPAAINVSGPGNSENWGALRVDSGANFSGPVNLLGNASIGAQNTSSGTISGAISDGGSGYSVTKLGAQPVILTGANTYGGGTTISNGTLQVGNSLVNGTLPGNVNIAVSNTTLTFVVATNTSLTYNGTISGPGSLVENGYGGTLNLNGVNTFTNSVTITAGALWITNAGALGTNSKVINLSNGTAGHPELHLNGISGNILLPSYLALTTSWGGGNGSQGVIINEAGNNEIDGNFNVTSGGGGTTIIVNGGTLKLAGNLVPNTTSRTLQFGGASNGTVTGVIADGSGANLLTGITISGPGTWIFAATNTYVTNTTVSGGTLLVNGTVGTGVVTVQTNATLGGSGTVYGTATLQTGGALQGGDASYTNTLTVGTLNLGSSSTNLTYSRFTVAAGGMVAVTNLNVSGTNIIQIQDPSLAIGTNTLFTYKGTIGGSSGFAGFQLGSIPAGVAAQLLNTGSAVQLAVTPLVTVATNSPTLTNVVSGGSLTLSWPADHIGWRLLVQTNNLTTGVSSNTNDWMTVAASAATNQAVIPIDATKPTEFYRLIYP
jgi:autotransporter-associated beta strand protein